MDASATSARCPVLQDCGGCPSAGEADQLAAHGARIARLMGRDPDLLVPSPRAHGYRARLTLRRARDGRPAFHQARTHRLVAIEQCALARPEIGEVLRSIGPLPEGLQSMELRSDGSSVVLASSGRRGAHIAPTDGVAGVAHNGRTISGDPRTHLSVAGVDHALGPQTFYQANLEVNAHLVAAVGRVVSAWEPTQLLDLYSGAGNLSLPLARTVPTILVESSPSAVDDARQTAARHDLRAEVIKRDADRVQAGEHFFDVLILDPPRAGAPGVLERLVLTRPKGIVYVSCNASALARDIRPALAAGYRIVRLEVYEMFPQTRHVEVLCALQR